MLKTGYHRIRFQRSHLWISIILILCFAHSFALPIESADSGGPQLGHAHNSTSSDPSGTLARLRRSTESESVPSSHAYTSESSNSTGLSRFRRNPADKFANSISKLEALARISSGIFLEIGLIDGSIPSDDVIAELLRMGDLKSQDIINLDQTTIDKVLLELEKFPKSLPAVSATEKRLVFLETLKGKASEYSDIKEIPGLKEYQESFEKVKGLKNLESQIDGFKAGIDGFTGNLGTLKVKGTNQDVNFAVKAISIIYDYLQMIQTSAQNFESITNPLTEAKKIQGNPGFLQFLLTEDGLREELQHQFSYTDANVNSVIENFGKVSQAFKDSSQNLNSFESIQKLIASRKRLYRQTFKHFSGLPKGPVDLKLLSFDSADPWVTKHVSNGPLVTESLKKAFTPLATFRESLEHVESQWDPVLAKHKSVDEIISLVLEMKSVPDNTQVLTDLFLELRKCDEATSGYSPTGLQSLKALRQAMSTLSQKMNEISDFDYISKFKNLQTLMKDFDFTGKSDTEKTEIAKETLKKLATDKNLQQFETDLAVLSGDISKLKTFIGNSALISDVDMAIVTRQEKNIRHPIYQTALNCLKLIPANGFPGRQMSEVTERTRKVSVTPEAKSIFNAIVKSGNGLSNSMQSAESLKNEKNRDVEQLKTSFLDYQDSSQRLGMGVQGLAAISKVSLAREKLNPLLEKIDEILKDAEIHGLSKTHRDGLQDLNKISPVLKSIDDFLNSAQLGLRRKRNADFSSSSSIFEQASKIQGAQIDMKTVREALEALKVAVPKIYDQAVTSLDTLESLDLDFSRFQIQNAIPSLASMDEFFNKYVKELSKPVPTTPPAVQGPPPGSSAPLLNRPSGAPSPTPSASRHLETTEEPNEILALVSGYWWTGLIALVVIGILTVILRFFGLCCGCCYKQKEEEILDEHTKSDSKSGKSEKKVKKSKEEKGEKKSKEESKSKEDPPNKPPKDPEEKKNRVSKVEKPKIEDASKKAEKKTEEPKDEKKNKKKDKKKVPKTPPPPPPPAVVDVAPPPIEKKFEEQPTQPILSDMQMLSFVSHLVSLIKKACLDGSMPSYWAHQTFNKLIGLDLRSANEYEEQHRDERRDHRTNFCVQKTMAVIEGFADNFINVNTCRFGQYTWLFGQVPFGRRLFSDVETRDKHMAAIDTYDIGFVAQLTEFSDECPPWFSEKVGGVMTHGVYTVATKDFVEDIAQFKKSEFSFYRLQYSKNGGTPKTVDVIILNKNKKFIYDDAVVEVVNMCDSYKKNVFVCCRSGVGLTGVVGATKHGIEICQEQTFEHPVHIFAGFVERRHNAIQNVNQMLLTFLSIAKSIIEKRQIGYFHDYWALAYYYDKIYRNVYACRRLELNDIPNKDGTFRRSAPQEHDLIEDLKSMEKFCKKMKEEYEATLKVAQAKSGEKKSKKSEKKTSKKSEKVEKKSEKK